MSDDKQFGGKPVEITFNGMPSIAHDFHFDLPKEDELDAFIQNKRLQRMDATFTFQGSLKQVRRWPMLLVLKPGKFIGDGLHETNARVMMFPRKRHWWRLWLFVKLVRYAHLPIHRFFFVERAIYGPGNVTFEHIVLWQSIRSRWACIWQYVREHWDEWSFELMPYTGALDE